MIAALGRVLGGFILACLAAGLVQVLFVITPAELATIPGSAFADKASEALMLALHVATHAAIFASVFALVAMGIGEWMNVRTPLYYAAVGVAIALLGFFAQFSSEVAGQPTIFNAYAVLAYGMAGLLAGMVYWAAAGRHAHDGDTREAEVYTPPPKPDRPRIIVERSPGDSGERRTLPERLKARTEALAGKASETRATEVPEITVDDVPPPKINAPERDPARAPSPANRPASTSAPVTSVPSTQAANGKPAGSKPGDGSGST